MTKAKLNSFIEILDNCIDRHQISSIKKTKIILLTKDKQKMEFKTQVAVASYFKISQPIVSMLIKSSENIEGWKVATIRTEKKIDQKLKGVPVIVSRHGTNKTFSSIKLAAKYIESSPEELKQVLTGYRKRVKGWDIYRV